MTIMDVLILSHMYPSTYNDVYGIFVHEQVKALIKLGVEVKVISPVPWAPFPVNIMSEKWKKYSMVPKYENRENVSVWYPRYITIPKALFLESSGERMYKGLQYLVKNIYSDFKFDLIHAHVALPDGYAAMKLAKDFNVPHVITIHGQDLQQTLYKNEQCKEILLKAIHSANKIVLVSNKLNNIIKKYCDDKNNKINVIANGVDADYILNNRMKKTNNERNKIILSVSNLIKTKGIDLNIQAFSKLTEKYQNLRYFIIGDGTERKNLEILSKDLVISEKVEFLGIVSHNDVMKYMADADIFSLPSWNEAFGVVYIEAMAHGKPVIGCKGEGIEDFVDDGETGLLVNPKDVDSLAQAMDFLLSNPDKANAIGERARELVLENYTWEKNAEKTLKAYQEVLNNAR